MNAEPKDIEFLYQVYASTRADEMALVDWTAEQKEAFIRMQFNAQREHYQTHYPKASNQIIQQEGVSIGRLIVERSQDPLLLIDIALLPEYRRTGIGTTLIRDLMDEAARLNWSIILHVESFNPAMNLYNRLGFIKVAEQGIYHEMKWQPTAG